MMRKMRIVAIASLIGCLLFSCGEQSGESVVEVEGAPEGAIVTAYVDVPGLVRATVRNEDVIMMEGDLLNGQRHGSWTEFASDGPVKSVTTYMDGKKHGVSLKFDVNGTVTEKANYANGILNGETKVYNRRRVVEVKTYVDGNLEGMVRKYYTNGKLMEEAPYKNGKYHGLAKWYDEEGNLSFAYRYENGELVDKNPEIEE